MAFVGDGNRGFTDEGLGGKFFANPKKVTTLQSGGGDRIFEENVYHNVNTGELLKPAPAASDPNKIFDNQPGSFAGNTTPGAVNPSTGYVDSDLRLDSWSPDPNSTPRPIKGPDFENAPKLDAAKGVNSSSAYSVPPTPPKPPTPPSTRPYIWKKSS